MLVVWDQDFTLQIQILFFSSVLIHKDFHFISFIQNALQLVAHFPNNNFLVLLHVFNSLNSGYSGLKAPAGLPLFGCRCVTRQTEPYHQQQKFSGSAFFSVQRQLILLALTSGASPGQHVPFADHKGNLLHRQFSVFTV